MCRECGLEEIISGLMTDDISGDSTHTVLRTITRIWRRLSVKWHTVSRKDQHGIMFKDIHYPYIPPASTVHFTLCRTPSSYVNRNLLNISCCIVRAGSGMG